MMRLLVCALLLAALWLAPAPAAMSTFQSPVTPTPTLSPEDCLPDNPIAIAPGSPCPNPYDPTPELTPPHRPTPTPCGEVFCLPADSPVPTPRIDAGAPPLPDHEDLPDAVKTTREQARALMCLMALRWWGRDVCATHP
jgi:hypothetical protein